MSASGIFSMFVADRACDLAFNNFSSEWNNAVDVHDIQRDAIEVFTLFQSMVEVGALVTSIFGKTYRSIERERSSGLKR